MKRFSINPVGIVVWIWLIVMNGILCATNYVFAIFFHEMGHFLMAKKCGYKLSKFSLSPYGVELSYFQQNLNYKDELKISLAGPIANVLTAFLIFGIWWVFPVVYFATESFVEISVVLAVFNLLPAYPLDGGRIFVCIFSHFFDTKKAKKLTLLFNVAFSILFFVMFVICAFFNFNPTLLLFSLFLIAGGLELNSASSFEKTNIFLKEIKNFVAPNIYVVNLDVTIKQLIDKIQLSKTEIFCLILDNGEIINLSEKMVINLSIKYGINKSLKDIF